MNLVLIGYRGTGKSTVAKILAATLGWQTVSTDARIVELAQQTIPDIVAHDGWNHFRDLETAVCAALKDQDRLVIDTGGGIILRPNNMEILKPNGLVFWLTATVSTITQRISRETQRPSLTGGKTFIEEIADVLRERTPKYQAAADHRMATDHASPAAIANQIVAAFLHGSANQSL